MISHCFHPLISQSLPVWAEHAHLLKSFLIKPRWHLNDHFLLIPTVCIILKTILLENKSGRWTQEFKSLCLAFTHLFFHCFSFTLVWHRSSCSALVSEQSLVLFVELCVKCQDCAVPHIPLFFEWDDLQPWPVYHARQETKSSTTAEEPDSEARHTLPVVLLVVSVDFPPQWHASGLDPLTLTDPMRK